MDKAWSPNSNSTRVLIDDDAEMAVLDTRPEQMLYDGFTDQIPPGVHSRLLTGRDPNGCDIARVLLWVDRTYSRCPSCGQSITVDLSDLPPAVLNEGAGAGGAVESVSQQHGCGQWLGVDWRSIDVTDPTDEVFDRALLTAEKMHIAWNAELNAERGLVEDRLNRVLKQAKEMLLEPLADGETRADRLAPLLRGSETEPGAYLDGDTVIVWDCDPADPSSTIGVQLEINQIDQAEGDAR
jgi:hypothetical protein